MELHGIELKPGMVLEVAKDDLWIVIPKGESGIAFVSYNKDRCWTCQLPENIKAIYNHTDGCTLKGDLLWCETVIKPGDYVSYYNNDFKYTHIGKVKEIDGNFAVMDTILDVYDRITKCENGRWPLSGCSKASSTQRDYFKDKIQEQGGYFKEGKIHFFESYDRVLVKLTEDSVWVPTLISYVEKGQVFTIDHDEPVYKVIPFSGNRHLIGNE